MNTLPEELLSHIVSHLVPKQPLLTRPEFSTLYSLCKTSRRLLRITKPYLYTCIRSTSSVRAYKLLRVLEGSPTLAKRVQSFSVQHPDEVSTQVTEAVSNDIPETVEHHAHLTILTIKLIPHLTTLDLLQYPNSKDDNPVWRILYAHSDPNKPMTQIDERDFTVTCLPHLRSLSVQLGKYPVRKLLPFFKLPTLRTLELDMRYPPLDRLSRSPRYETGTSIEHLRIIGCDPSRQCDVHWLSDELINLSSLFLATSKVRTETPIIVWLFGRKQLTLGLVKSIWIMSREVGWCEVEFEAGEENAEMYSIACMGVLLRACGQEVNVGEGKGVARAMIRELTEEEQTAYEVRFGFVRRPGGTSGGMEDVSEGSRTRHSISASRQLE